MATSCPPLLPPASQNCSGRGVCVSDTICSCEAGWTGRGDFAFLSPSCDVNLGAIEALYAILAIAHFLQMPICVLYLRTKLDPKRVKKNKYSKLPIAMGFLLLLSNILFSSLGVLRAANPGTRTIGTDPAATVLFGLGGSVYWTAIHVFILGFIEVVHRQALRFRQGSARILPLEQIRVAISTTCALVILFSMAPLGMLTANDASRFLVFGAMHYVGLGSSALLLGLLVVPYYIRKLQNEVKSGRRAIMENVNGNTTVALDALLFKLKRFDAELRKQVFPQFAVATIFGLWPFLQVHGSSYWIPMAWTMATFISSLGMYLNSPISAQSSNTPSSDDKLNGALTPMFGSDRTTLMMHSDRNINQTAPLVAAYELGDKSSVQF